MFSFLLGIFARQKDLFESSVPDKKGTPLVASNVPCSLEESVFCPAQSLERMGYQQAKRWFILAFAVGIPWWLSTVPFGISMQGQGRVIIHLVGGWNGLALSYALWESFFCVSIILALIGIFKKHFNTQNSLQRFLSINAFGVYVFHSPILVAVSLLIKNIDLPAILKFGIVLAIVLPTTFVVTCLLRKIPVLRVIFS